MTAPRTKTDRTGLAASLAKRGGALRAANEVVVTLDESLLQGNSTIDAGPGNFIGPAIYCQGCADLSFFSFDDSHVFEVGGSILQSTTGFNCGSGDAPASLGYNVLSDESCGFATAGDLENTDALLGTLAANSGLTPTHRPAAGAVEEIIELILLDGFEPLALQ